MKDMYVLNVITGKTFISMLDNGHSLQEVKRLGRTGLHKSSHNQISILKFRKEKERTAHQEYLEEIFKSVSVRYIETVEEEEVQAVLL